MLRVENERPGWCRHGFQPYGVRVPAASHGDVALILVEILSWFQAIINVLSVEGS